MNKNNSETILRVVDTTKDNLVLVEMTFENRPLRDLLIEAIRYGNDPKVRERLWQVVDHSMNTEKFRELISENALTEDSMDVSPSTVR